MNGVRRSLLMASGDRYVTVVLNLVGMAVLARFLTPDEIGVFAVGATFVMLAELLREFGVSTYLIQEKELSAAGIHTSFTVMLLLSLGLVGLIWVSAEPLATAYGDDRLAPNLRIAGGVLLLAPFSAPVLALLRREMAFGRLAAVNIAAAVANLTVSVGLAVAGAGHLCMALGMLSSAMATVSLAWLWRRDHQFRGNVHRFGFSEWRKVLHFGGYASATTVMNTFSANLPQLVIGRLVGFDAVGLYSRALMLCQVPERLILSACVPVMLSAFAEQSRSGGDMRAAYLRGLSFLSALMWPFLLCLVLMADPAVHALLGPQWGPAVPLVRIIGLASLFTFPAALTYPILVGLGHVRDTLVSSLISLPISALLVCAAAFWGVEAVAASMFVTLPLQVGVALTLIRRRLAFSWNEVFEAVWRSGVLALAAATPPAVAVGIVGWGLDLPIPALLAILAASAAAWAAAVVATSHPLLDEARGALAHVRWPTQRAQQGIRGQA